METTPRILSLSTAVPTADALHAVYRHGALDLGTRAAQLCLDRAGLAAREVDYIVATTCTGYVCPGLSARLGLALGMRCDLQRADLVGMGGVPVVLAETPRP